MDGLNRFSFKILLTFFMVLDHIDFFVPYQLSIIFKILSRFVAVGFAYLAVEGFCYTKNIKKYLTRLFGFAFFMILGNTFFSFLYSSKDIVIYNSIILTFSLGVSFLYVYEKVDNVLLKYFIMFILLLSSLFSEGGIFILPFMLVTYIHRNNENSRNKSYLIMSFILFLIALIFCISNNDFSFLITNPDYLFITIIPILKLYNGKNGPNNIFSKYFFYLFYPIHLWIIASLEYFLIK